MKQIEKHSIAFLKFLSIGVLLLWIPLDSHSQQNHYYGKVDTIKLSKGDKLVLNDTAFSYDYDTILYVPKNTRYKVKVNPETKTENFYQKIEEKASGKKWTQSLYEAIFRKPSDVSLSNNEDEAKSESPYKQFEGYQIRTIEIKRIDVFGPTVYDTARTSKRWFNRTANNLQFNTRAGIIKNSLLFNEGEPLDALDVSDSERLLRSLPYIRDSRIIVKPDVTGEYVDILVITQDLWTIGGEIDIADIDEVKIDFYNKNILGFGHQQTNTVYYHADKPEKNGYNGYYRAKNMFGAYVDGEFNYYNRYDTEIIRLSFSRGFVSPQIKYAGGVTVQQTGLPPLEISTDKRLIESPIRYNYNDIWIARGINLTYPKKRNKRPRRLIIAGRVNKKSFIERPEVFQDSNFMYYNITHFLGSLALSKREFYKGNLIYSYGRTEDIPHGYLVQYTLGTTVDDFNNRFYTAIHLSTGKFIRNYGYFYSSLSTGGYLHENKIHQGITDFDFRYFTPLFNIRGYKSRNFLTLRLTYGFNRLPYENLTINNEYGIRNFIADDLTGINRIKISYESILFTPIRFIGFRFAVFGFADFAALGDQLNFMFTEKFYSGLGLGLRIRNDNLAIRAFEIKFVFFPEIPSDRPNFMSYYTNIRTQEFNDFATGAPGVMRYR